ncbi:hypothetical protein EDD85DRAFT_796691 [Armillaria nabsnona]|nr:hypothetical protein EDD85DRAFT_796691 [Armillaria nabsnona]
MYVALIGLTFFDDIDFYVVRRNIPIAFEIVLSHLLPNLFKPVINLKFRSSVDRSPRPAYVIQGGHLPTFVELKELKSLPTPFNVLAAAGDVAISAAIYTLQNSAKSGFAWSDHIINRFFYSNSLLATLDAGKPACQNSIPYKTEHGIPRISEERSLRSQPMTMGIMQKPQVVSQQIQVQIETIKHDYMGDEIHIHNDTGLVASYGQSLEDLNKTPSDFPYTGRS